MTVKVAVIKKDLTTRAKNIRIRLIESRKLGEKDEFLEGRLEEVNYALALVNIVGE